MSQPDNLLRPYVLAADGQLTLKLQAIVDHEKRLIERAMSPEQAFRLAADLMESLARLRGLAVVRQPTDSA